MANPVMTPEKVLAWLAQNPDALRTASAGAAVTVLNGPEVTAALTVLTAAIAADQDSNPAPLSAAREGVMGSREVLQGLVAAVNTARHRAAKRVEYLTPAPVDGAVVVPGEEGVAQ